MELSRKYGKQTKHNTNPMEVIIALCIIGSAAIFAMSVYKSLPPVG